MKLSIITINYNNKDGLLKTIKSIINQTSNSFEYIIIDGGSTDGSLDIIKEYEEEITYWISEPDRGIYNAMNKGIVKAVGEYLLFMNSGDCLYDNKVIADSIPFLNGTDIVVGNMSCGKIYNSPDEITFKILYSYTIPHQAAFIRRELQNKYLYNENLKIVSDWEFFLMSLIFNNASYCKIPFTISEYDMNGISSTNADLYKEERKTVLLKMIPERILKDYECFYYGKKSKETSLYNYICDSGYNKIMYTINVFILRFFSLFRKSSSWIRKYPLFLK